MGRARDGRSNPLKSGVNWRSHLWFLAVALLFGAVYLQQWRLPGVYEDAVNPDYLVVNPVNHARPPVEGMHPAGNFPFHRFPVLIQLYHGALPYYLGLPSYSIFGTGLLGIRITHLMFGVFVLAGAAAFISAFRVRRTIAAFALAALAVDPGFIFSFRSQFHITALPISLVLASIGLTERSSGRPAPIWAFLAGLLCGAAVYGYFIYVFIVQAAFLHAAARWRGAAEARGLLAFWIAGFALGLSAYGIGLLLIARATGGLGGAADQLTADLSTLHVTRSSLSLHDRLELFVRLVEDSLAADGQAAMLFNHPVSSFAAVRGVLLLGLPGLTLIAAVLSRREPAGLSIVAGFIAGLSALVLAFGDRLGSHHFSLLLPILYCAMAITVEWWSRTTAWRPAVTIALSLAAIGPLILSNVINLDAFWRELRRTGGVGLSSDAINRFADDRLAEQRALRMFFPDWGVYTSFVMLTHGQFQADLVFMPEEARATLCNGRDVGTVLFDGDRAAHVAEWSAQMNWRPPVLTTYRQRDSTPLFTFVRWIADVRPDGACDRTQ